MKAAQIPAAAFLLAAALAPAGCLPVGGDPKPRLVLFAGVDVSGSFRRGGSYEHSLDFLSRYLYAHLNGLGGLERPFALFVGSIGGARPQDPKSFFPMESFEGMDAEAIRAKLAEIFSERENPYTDFNAFFRHVAETVQARRMMLKPVAVVLVTDGVPDFPGKNYKNPYRHVDLSPLERVSRNVTVRLLYTTPRAAAAWRNEVPRRRVKVWTQDAIVMGTWSEPNVYEEGKPPAEQEKFLNWVKKNVDFGVRAKRVE